MKLCLLADASSPHTRKWVKGCLKPGWEVTVISHSDGEIPGARVIIHPLGLNSFPLNCWSVRRLIRGLNPDIVHAHQLGAHGLYAWFSGCKILINSAWGSDVLVNPRRSRLLRQLVRFLIRHSTAITSDSRQVTEELIRLGADPGQIIPVLFGLERPVFERLASSSRPQTPFIICSPRLHEPIYNLPVLLEAFERIYREFDDVWLWVLGDGGLTPELTRYVTEHQLERVRFWGRVSPGQALELMAKSHLMVSIPSSDGTPVSMLEAMAAGCLPVVSDLPVYRDWIKNGINGLITGSTPVQVADALRKGIHDAELRCRAAEQNRGLIAERAIWEDQFQAMIDFYQKAVESR
jgi:glycosyltransferase involved in cell wall biosynthesis